MDILGLLIVASMNKGVVEQPVLQPLFNQRSLTHELIAQIPPVHKLQKLVDTPEKPISEPEIPQFSPTVILEGEVILGVNGVSGKDLDDSVVFGESVELKLNVSFTGEDLLEIGIESGNLQEFSYVGHLTFEGRLGFLSDTNSNFLEISQLSYEFPISERASLYISANGNDINDFNPFFDRNDNSGTTEFGSENPIHNLVEDAGIQINYDLTDELSFSLGYYSGGASDPQSGAGLFNGDYSAFVQLEFEPSADFLLGFTYIYSYNDSNLKTETGSLRSQIDLEHPVIGHSYGISASFALNSRFTIGGWVGWTNATVIHSGQADVWNYALTLAFPDLGKEDNLLWVVIGQEPRLTGTRGFMIDGRKSDPDQSLHIELFYDYRLSENISVTPGLVWITAPNHDTRNPDILVFTVKTTFKF